MPDVDERTLVRVQGCLSGFEAVTEDGAVLRNRTVALAVGVLPFVKVPATLRDLGPSYVSHSSHHGELSRFRGRDVTVIGGGQAALETAALLSEQGTLVWVMARAGQLICNGLPRPGSAPGGSRPAPRTAAWAAAGATGSTPSAPACSADSRRPPSPGS